MTVLATANIFFIQAMQQAPEVTKKQLLEKIQEIRKKIDKPKYYVRIGELSWPDGNTPLAYLNFIESNIRQKSNIELKDIRCEGKPIIDVLAKNDECYEILVFLINHDVPANQTTLKNADEANPRAINNSCYIRAWMPGPEHYWEYSRSSS